MINLNIFESSLFFNLDDGNTDVDINAFSNSIKIVVPEGMVVGVDPENMHSVTWQFKVCLLLYSFVVLLKSFFFFKIIVIVLCHNFRSLLHCVALTV